jgi:hypothetical protein
MLHVVAQRVKGEVVGDVRSRMSLRSSNHSKLKTGIFPCPDRAIPAARLVRVLTQISWQAHLKVHLTPYSTSTLSIVVVCAL